jgi:hypothetical protein
MAGILPALRLVRTNYDVNIPLTAILTVDTLGQSSPAPTRHA